MPKNMGSPTRDSKATAPKLQMSCEAPATQSLSSCAKETSGAAYMGVATPAVMAARQVKATPAESTTVFVRSRCGFVPSGSRRERLKSAMHNLD